MAEEKSETEAGISVVLDTKQTTETKSQKVVTERDIKSEDKVTKAQDEEDVTSEGQLADIS